MIVAFIGDSHWCERHRFEECKRVHAWIAEDVARREVDLIVHTGDLYDRPTVPDERGEASEWVQRMAHVAPMYLVRGNHDPVGDLPILERLSAPHPIRVVESVGVEVAQTKAGPVALALLGWPQRSNIAKLAAMAGREEVELAAGEALRSVFRYFGMAFDALDPAMPRIVAAHAMVRASRVSTGQPLVGCDFEIGVEDLALARADFYALGHVHLGQEWLTPDGAPVVYPGSPRRTNFGELEPKGYVVVDFGSDRVAVWQRVETPCTPMVLLQDEWGWDDHTRSDGWIVGLDGYERPETVRGAEVKFRYKVPASKREAAALAAADTERLLREDGAIDVVIESEVIVEQRARAPEVSRATTLPAKLQALWASRGFDPGARREALLSKLEELQA